jgi:hypothetical protein
MVETLQQFSTTNLTQMVVALIAVWAIWPVVCGALGASKGQGSQGFLHGLLWGPLGVPIVLLSKKKYTCPTCGHKTLSRPPETARPAAIVPPPQLVRPFARPSSTLIDRPRQADTAPPGMAIESATLPASDSDEEEAAKLHAWVNSD